MSDNREVLDFLRARFDRVDAALANVRADISELKTRVGFLERSNASLHAQGAELSVRVDRLADSVERHDRRFDLAEALSGLAP